MNSTFIRLWLAVVGAAGVSCSSTGTAGFSEHGISVMGLRISAPKGSGWSIQSQSPHEIVYTKGGANKPRGHILAFARVQRVPDKVRNVDELERFARKYMAQAGNGAPNFAGTGDLIVERTTIHGRPAVFIQWVFPPHDEPTHRSPPNKQVIFEQCLFVQHPQFPVSLVVQIGYRQTGNVDLNSISPIVQTPLHPNPTGPPGEYLLQLPGS